MLKPNDLTKAELLQVVEMLAETANEITMEGLRKLNTLIWKYTTVHDGGADHEAD